MIPLAYWYISKTNINIEVFQSATINNNAAKKRSACLFLWRLNSNKKPNVIAIMTAIEIVQLTLTLDIHLIMEWM